MTKKELSISEFAGLHENMQFEALYRHGVFIGKRKLQNRAVILYQLNGFYVELFYIEYRKTIDRIITSDNTDILMPYLEQVIISGIPGNRDSKL